MKNKFYVLYYKWLKIVHNDLSQNLSIIYIYLVTIYVYVGFSVNNLLFKQKLYSLNYKKI